MWWTSIFPPSLPASSPQLEAGRVEPVLGDVRRGFSGALGGVHFPRCLRLPCGGGCPVRVLRPAPPQPAELQRTAVCWVHSISLEPGRYSLPREDREGSPIGLRAYYLVYIKLHFNLLNLVTVITVFFIYAFRWLPTLLNTFVSCLEYELKCKCTLYTVWKWRWENAGRPVILHLALTIDAMWQIKCNGTNSPTNQ